MLTDKGAARLLKLNMEQTESSKLMRALGNRPGAILLHEFMKPKGIGVAELSKAIGLSAGNIRHLIRKCKRLNAKTAILLAEYFGTKAEFWMGLQMDYELRIAREKIHTNGKADKKPLT